MTEDEIQEVIEQMNEQAERDRSGMWYKFLLSVTYIDFTNWLALIRVFCNSVMFYVDTNNVQLVMQ